MSNTPGEIIEVIDNPMFNNKKYREEKDYLQLYLHIKNLIKKGWDK